ncbi:putative Ulp1 protease family catalytic domain, papain-like cysteine peptidase superfamily [Plasmopara halstedii]
MRLGLDSSSPIQAPQASTSLQFHEGLSSSSRMIPIDVNSDSSEDPEPLATYQHSALTSSDSELSVSSHPSSTSATSINLKRSLSMTIRQSVRENQLKDDEEFPSSYVTRLDERRNFLYNVNDRSKPKQQISGNSFSSISKCSTQVLDEPFEIISAARTDICGQKFDRCELEFIEDRVELTIWKHNKAHWQGQIKYAHMDRFCFSRGNNPPYILLLELNNLRNGSDFATFYDSIFAKVCEEEEAREQASPKLYGIVFFFDEEIDYMRCQSMGDNNPRLEHLFQQQLPESEAQKYLRSDASSRSRNRIGPINSNFGSAVGRGMASIVGNRARTALNSVSLFFRPTSRPSILETSPIWDSNHNAQRRALNLTLKRDEEVATDLSKDIASMLNNGDKTLIDTANHNGKQNRGLDGVTRNETLVTQQNTEIEEKHMRLAFVDDVSLQHDGYFRDIVENRKSVAASQCVDEQLKRRKLNGRRNEVISVTLGDVDRLVPGEYLNDNIIDFYLRFLWRHLASWQQQQTYFFTTHFFTQLNNTKGAFDSTRVDSNERFARVARWTQKETNLFDKRFLFIPINDSFHWSIAVFCNPGSAVIKKHRRIINRHVMTTACNPYEREFVNLADGDGGSDGIEENAMSAPENDVLGKNCEEEELQASKDDRLANPPCLLFLDSLRCHRKKKFTEMLRDYFECEWKARYASSAGIVSGSYDGFVEDESIVSVFDSGSIILCEPNIPLQRNSSDCGVFLLMYAALIVHNFPTGVTRKDLENNLAPTLTSDMFQDEHIEEFREYLQQLLFCLQFLEKHGLSEDQVKDEGLEFFTID